MDYETHEGTVARQVRDRHGRALLHPTIPLYDAVNITYNIAQTRQ